MKKLLTLLLFVGMFLPVVAQFNIGGNPESFSQNMPDVDAPVALMPAINMSQVAAEDALNDANGGIERMAIGHDVDFTTNNAGTWYQKANGDKIWKMRIRSKYAEGMFLNFSNFQLPSGARLYIYSKNRDHVIGAYTNLNNTNDGVFGTQLIPGQEIVVEYVVPFISTNLQGGFTIDKVFHAYRQTNWNKDGYPKDFGDSEACEVNINCFPGASQWQTMSKGVARVLVVNGGSAGWCSGSLVNNTAQDCTPYFLFAYHCATFTTPGNAYNTWIYYFNYEAPGCTNPGSQGTLNSDTWSGCTVRAHSNDGGGNSGSDFLLTELTGATVDATLQGYGCYFNGWDASTVASGTYVNGASIHHPAGDIKKISTYTAGLINTQWGSAAGSHWRVTWTSNAYGHGVTEGGSSGSPIFNSSGLLVGTLTGGSS